MTAKTPYLLYTLATASDTPSIYGMITDALWPSTDLCCCFDTVGWVAGRASSL